MASGDDDDALVRRGAFTSGVDRHDLNEVRLTRYEVIELP